MSKRCRSHIILELNKPEERLTIQIYSRNIDPGTPYGVRLIDNDDNLAFPQLHLFSRIEQARAYAENATR